MAPSRLVRVQLLVPISESKTMTEVVYLDAFPPSGPMLSIEEAMAPYLEEGKNMSKSEILRTFTPHKREAEEPFVPRPHENLEQVSH